MKTTKKDFDVFVKECRHWIKVFELNRYRIDFLHKKLDNARAACSTKYWSKVVTIFLDTNWDKDEVTVENLKATAFHEVMELFLSPLSSLTHSEEMDRNCHEIIYTMQNIVYPLLKKRNA